MEFNSILRFIEQDFRIPAVRPADRQASSLATSLNFHQQPLRPTILNERNCPASDYHINTGVSGQVVKLSKEPYGRVMLVRIKGGTILTVIIGPSTRIRTENHGPARIADLAIGDTIHAGARPDPQKALVYGAGSIVDTDVQRVTNKRGVVNFVDFTTGTIDLNSGSSQIIVDLSPRTQYGFPNGKRARLTNIAQGDTIAVTGDVNRRVGQMTSAVQITILHQPRAKGNPKS
jgi:hypothetical protein